MRIAVIHPDSGWILSRLARELCEAASDTFFLANLTQGRLHFSGAFDAIYYMDVQNCWGSLMRDMYPDVLHVGMFTHADRDDLATARPDISNLDGIVHMCRRYYDRFLKAGRYPKERMVVIPPGQQCSSFKLRPLRLGVCQRGGFPGKGDPFLFEALAGLLVEVRRHVELNIKGSGWRDSWMCWESRLDPLRVILDDNECQADYLKWYDNIDYLLVPSLYEGGPMAVQEALACGILVISADVGFVPEMLTWTCSEGALDKAPEYRLRKDNDRVAIEPGCYIFPPGDVGALCQIITSLYVRRSRLRRRVEGLSWKSYAEKLEAFVETLR